MFKFASPLQGSKIPFFWPGLIINFININPIIKYKMEFIQILLDLITDMHTKKNTLFYAIISA